MRISIRVIPNAKAFGIEKRDGKFIVRVAERAEKGKATIELIRQLSKKLGRRVAIVRGSTSRSKVIEIEGEESEILRQLEEICG